MTAGSAAPLAGRRIGLLTASASRLGGGVFEAVVRQAGIIRSLGGEVAVFALVEPHADGDATRLDAPVHRYSVTGPRRIGFAPGLVRGLVEAELDCLHLHGIWMYPSAAGAAWAQRTGRAYVVSPHGMLDPWITARGRLKKGLARWGYERRSWAAARLLHALTAREAADIARETGRSDALIVPNPGPEAAALPADPGPPLVAYVGRIHPKKNLVQLIAAWRAAERPAGARLVIAGWGEAAHVSALHEALAGGDGSAEYVGPLFGANKEALLRAARWVVLPSLSEGLPMAMLEAWACGRPTIMTGECNLPEGLVAGAALPCGYDAASIAPALARACAMAMGEWRAMANAAAGLAAGKFGQAAVARQWGEAYAGAIAAKGPHA